MTRLAAVALVALTATIAAQGSGQAPALPTDFPVADSPLRDAWSRGQRMKAARDAFKTAGDRAATADLLFKSGRNAEGLTALERVVASRPSEMAAAFAAVGSKAREFAGDKAHNYAERLRAAVAAAQRQLPSMPREEAADLARALMSVETELNRSNERDGWRRRLSEFVSSYAGTRAATLARVDLLTDRIGPQMLDALDTFVREHPGSEAAAKALYQKGFHLGHNATSFGEKSGADPTERFFRVLEISKELRSGRYPASEWVEKALSLVTSFFAYKATYAPGNPERILAVYEALLPELLAEYEANATRDSISYVIGSRMGELFKLAGDPLPAIEAVFDRLERQATNPNTVRLLRANFYLRPNDPVIEAKDRPALKLKAAPVLEALARESRGAEQRAALAALATLRFGNGELEAARQLYQQFVQRFPNSDYAWVAALRGAEADEPANPKRAAEAFRRTAAQFKSNPTAAVLGHAYAARASEAAGDFRGALSAYEAALAACDEDYGPRYSLFSRRTPAPGEPFVTTDSGEVTQERLQSRVAVLRRTLTDTGGALVERARWSVEHGRWDDAVAAAREFASAHGKSPLAAEIRYLGHRARLEKALEMADADQAGAQAGPALDVLDALTREPVDSAVAAAKLALGTLIYLSGSKGDPDALVRAALADWQSMDTSQKPAAPRGPLERDVVEIRNVVFQPNGAGVFASGKGWNAFRWEGNAPYRLVSPQLRVKQADGTRSVVMAYDPFPEFTNVVFYDAERRSLLTKIMLKLGGTKKRPWVQVMQTPNQPAGAAVDVRTLWSRSFWAQPGHWGGWVFETYPIIGEIEFIDAARTRATVQVTVGYSGATVQMEKINGGWVAKELTNFWIT